MLHAILPPNWMVLELFIAATTVAGAIHWDSAWVRRLEYTISNTYTYLIHFFTLKTYSAHKELLWLTDGLVAPTRCMSEALAREFA